MTEPADGHDDRFPITNSEVPFTELRYTEIRNELDSLRRALIDLTATVDRLGALIPPLAPREQDLPPTSARALPSSPPPSQPAASPSPSATARPLAEAPAPDAETVAPPAEAPAPAAEVPTSPPAPVAPAPVAPAAVAPAAQNPVDAILGESFGRPT